MGGSNKKSLWIIETPFETPEMQDWDRYENIARGQITRFYPDLFNPLLELENDRELARFGQRNINQLRHYKSFGAPPRVQLNLNFPRHLVDQSDQLAEILTQPTHFYPNRTSNKINLVHIENRI